jgi:predicted nucleic acid-binding protein
VARIIKMICLDTNYLILGLQKGTSESAKLVKWYQAGEVIITPMPAWYEFLCGPITEQQVTTMRAFLDEVTPFGEQQAAKAAELFAATGRKRSLKIDIMIAATAMLAGAQLATNNKSDFRSLKKYGLILV